MQVIPKDTGWDTLADTMMKLVNAEIHDKALTLQELERQTELARQLGDRRRLEGLTGRDVPVANPMFQNKPERHPFAAELETMAQTGFSGDIAPEVLGGAAQSEVARSQWDKNPAVNRKYLEYENAGDAIQQMISNLHEQVQEKSPAQVRQLYNQTVGGLLDLGQTYRRKDIEKTLGPLQEWIGSAGGGTKPTSYKAYLSDAVGGGDITFTTAILPGAPGWESAIRQGAKESKVPGISMKHVTGFSKIGTGDRANPKPEVVAMAQTKIKEQAQERLDAISQDNTLSDKEKIAESKKIGTELGVIIKPYRGLKKISFEVVSFDPSNPQKVLDMQDTFMRSLFPGSGGKQPVPARTPQKKNVNDFLKNQGL